MIQMRLIELKFIEIDSKSFFMNLILSPVRIRLEIRDKIPWIGGFEQNPRKKSEFRLTDHLIRIRRICKRICFKFVPADHLPNFESKDLSLDSKITFGYTTGKRLITLKNQDWLVSELFPKINKNKISTNITSVSAAKRSFTRNQGWVGIFERPNRPLSHSCVLRVQDPICFILYIAVPVVSRARIYYDASEISITHAACSIPSL